MAKLRFESFSRISTPERLQKERDRFDRKLAGWSLEELESMQRVLVTHSAEANSRYQVLIQELPDPNRDLYSQVLGDSALHFRCFRKLPTEIRLKIWRPCLPGPRKSLFEPRRRFSREEAERLPSTLFINQESRHETLRVTNYAFFPRWEEEEGTPMFVGPRQRYVRHNDRSHLCMPLKYRSYVSGSKLEAISAISPAQACLQPIQVTFRSLH
jgi:hypothetical protein